MAIVVQCQCGKGLRVRDESAGKRVRCPSCGEVMLVPGEQVAPRAAAPSRVAPPAANACKACGKPVPVGVLVCPECGFSAQTNSYVKKQAARAVGSGPKVFFSLLGIDFTPVKVVIAVVLLAAVIFAGVWYFTGPGRETRIVSAKRLAGVVALDTVSVLQPADLRLGSFNLSGDAGAGVKVAPGMKVPSGVEVSTGDALSVGGAEKLIVTREDPAGRYLLVDVELSQGFLRKNDMEADLDVVFFGDRFTLEGPGGPIPGMVLKSMIGSGETIDLVNAKSSNYRKLMPPGFVPSSEKLNRRHGGVASGQLRYNPTTGLDGKLEFIVFGFQTDAPGVSGMEADGRLAMKDREGIDVDYLYNGDHLKVLWSPEATGWHSPPKFFRRQAVSPFHKFPVTLLFELPPDEGGQYELKCGTRRLGRIDPELTKPPKRHKVNRSKPQGYVDALLRTRQKARDVQAGAIMHGISQAMRMYVDEYGDMPERLEQLSPYLSGFDQVMRSPRTGKKDRFIYERPEPGAPAKTVVIYESLNGKPDKEGSVLYADLSVKVAR